MSETVEAYLVNLHTPVTVYGDKSYFYPSPWPTLRDYYEP
jgi:hypothetical protein